MAAQTLDQVLSSLSSVYDPQVQSVQAQQAALPQQQAADQQALQGQQTTAYNNILNGARARGTGVAFGGIPLGEQAQYNATTYMPALANLQASYNQKGASLQDAINTINENRFTAGNNIYQAGIANDQKQQQLDEQQREFNVQQPNAAKTANSLGSAFGGSQLPTSTTPANTPSQPQFIGNNDLRGHLNYLAQTQGNQDAAVALKYVGNDGKYNLNPYLTNPTILNALTRLGAVNVWKASAPTKTTSTAKAPVGGSGTNYLGGSTAGIGKF